jgi:hypothetical protein
MKPRVIACVKPFGSEVFCSSCLTYKAGRVYDLRVTLTDTLKGTVDGVATICERCRKDFDAADLELDSEAMFQDSERRRHDEEEDELEDMEHRSPFLQPVEHATFPVKRPVRG